VNANRRVLISGGGISGLTLAYWLQNRGFSPTIVEKRSGLDERGYMIDFYGSGFDVAEKMGLIEALRAKSDQYPISRLVFVDSLSRPRAALDVNKFRDLLHHRYFPLMRGDLESTLYNVLPRQLPIRFGAAIHTLEKQPDGVLVSLSDGTTELYDLVIGADGIHSNVRQLCWGEEKRFNHFLGFYVACSVIENFLGSSDTFLGHLEPNLQTAVYSIGNNKLATFFAFRSEKLQIHNREE
jgi:2-polyprenyl-6-methoxyphenol hydroxylase-like FAD-dependent oxidoreductase